MSMKYERWLAWILSGVAAVGCSQPFPPTSPVQARDPVVDRVVDRVVNPKLLTAPAPPMLKSKPFGAEELQQSLAQEARLLHRVQMEISDDRCTDDSDCTTIPIGEKACGGPERWLACTRESAKRPLLQPLLDELISLQKTRNAKSGMASNCQISPDPGAMCRANRCVLRPADGAT